MTYDVSRVRARYPALADGRAWLDGAAGTQVPEAVIEAMADVMRAGVANQGGVFPASRRADAIVDAARVAVADLLNVPDPDGVVLGPTMNALTYRFAAALGATWTPGDEIVVTEADHDANVRPWVQAAHRSGATVRVAPIDPHTGALPTDHVTGLINDHTRLVAVTAASNLTGARPDVPAIAAAAHRVGALSYVDGVHHCPHVPVDVTTLGADLYVTSAHKWAGPHVAAVVAAAPAVVAAIDPERPAPAPATGPARFEQGTNPFPALAGLVATVEHWAGLVPGEGGRRARLSASRAAAAEHGRVLGERLWKGLGRMMHVRRYGPEAPRTPIASFRIAGRTPAEVVAELDRADVNAWSGYAYAWEAAGALRVRDDGGLVRLSVNHYTDEWEVDRALEAVAAYR
ncbi:cysteine desulfurase-like protein [Pseudonocardia bannensis]|uniref:Cysteine desulfurase-like protein n=1 Tax=Pseudonocardia bannensis TaxID=630973 RepID=A0A848DS34_9PSEU|nr:cysteine desulfurase-like protein [Pseudonocardia bannensis]NMH95289.1 cysteine desulfurase-like protein [Pseudonocardia bannensis]